MTCIDRGMHTDTDQKQIFINFVRVLARFPNTKYFLDLEANVIMDARQIGPKIYFKESGIRSRRCSAKASSNASLSFSSKSLWALERATADVRERRSDSQSPAFHLSLFEVELAVARALLFALCLNKDTFFLWFILEEERGEGKGKQVVYWMRECNGEKDWQGIVKHSSENGIATEGSDFLRKRFSFSLFWLFVFLETL